MLILLTLCLLWNKLGILETWKNDIWTNLHFITYQQHELQNNANKQWNNLWWLRQRVYKMRPDQARARARLNSTLLAPPGPSQTVNMAPLTYWAVSLQLNLVISDEEAIQDTPCQTNLWASWSEPPADDNSHPPRRTQQRGLSTN